MGTVSELPNSDARARFLASVVPYLEVDRLQSILDQVLFAVSEVSNAFVHVEVLSEIFPFVPEDIRERLVEEVLALTPKIDNVSNRVSAVTELLPHLSGQLLQDTLEMILDQAWSISHSEGRAIALAALIPYFIGDQRDDLIRGALSAASEIPAQQGNKEVYDLLIGYVDAKHLWQLMIEGTDVAQPTLFRALIPYLEGNQPRDIWIRIQNITDAQDRVQLLSLLGKHSPDSSTAIAAEIHFGVLECVEEIRASSREDLLRFLADENLFNPEILPVETLQAIAEHIIDVCTEWEWQ